MALKDFLKRQPAPVEQTDDEGPTDFYATHSEVAPIGEARARQPITVVGEITSVRIVPKTEGSPWLEATVSDGTGKLIALWTGRRRIAGIASGQRLILTGRPAPSGPGGRLQIYNPLYELL